MHEKECFTPEAYELIEKIRKMKLAKRIKTANVQTESEESASDMEEAYGVTNSGLKSLYIPINPETEPDYL